MLPIGFPNWHGAQGTGSQRFDLFMFSGSKDRNRQGDTGVTQVARARIQRDGIRGK